jgi:hypothetical protein
MAAKRATNKGLRRGKKLEAQKTLGKTAGPVKYLNVKLGDVSVSSVSPNSD